MEIKLIQAPNTFSIRMASLKGIGCQVHLLWQLWFVFNHCNTNEAFPDINISFVNTYRIITWFILNRHCCACFTPSFLKEADISVLAETLLHNCLRASTSIWKNCQLFITTFHLNIAPHTAELLEQIWRVFSTLKTGHSSASFNSGFG